MKKLFTKLFSRDAPTVAGLDKGINAANEGDFVIALSEFQPLAKQGNAEAQYNLGLMYHNGLGVSQNYCKAVKWTRRAAEQGHAEAQFNLGYSYYSGDGVSQDYSEALRWYRLAAEQGATSAQINLGFMYKTGRGVLQDYILAYMWANLAFANGDKLGSRLRDDIERLMTDEQIAEAEEMTREWMEKNYKGG